MASEPEQKLTEDQLSGWVEAHAPCLRGYLSSLLRDGARAEDLVQEVFLRAWREREKFVEQGRTRAFLFRIADRLAMDELRSRSRRSERSLDGDWIDRREPAPEDRLIRQEERARLDRALARLTPAQGRVLMLRYFGELRFEEIAVIVGCPLGTALSHAHRGLEMLRAIFAEGIESQASSKGI